MPSPNVLQKKNVTLPLVWHKIVMSLPTLKDVTRIIKRDQLLLCAFHRRKRVALLPDLVQVATPKELS